MNELPPGWNETPLETVVDILDSKRIPLNSDEREQRISGKASHLLFPYYGATGQVGVIDDYLFDGDYILLGEDGVPFFDPFRHKAYRAHGKFWVNNHAHVLQAINGLSDFRFIEGYLNSFDYKGYVSGSTRLKLTQASMRSMPVRLAPLPEQKRIADKLDAVLARVDACRDRFDRIPAILKRFRQSVLAAATSGKLTEDWRLEKRLPEPEPKSLGEIIKVSSGKFLPAKDMTAGGTVPVYGGNGVNGYHDKGNVDSATLVIGRVGFYCGSVHLTPPRAWVTDNALIVRHDEKQTLKRFLYFALQATDLRVNDSSTAQPVISGAKIYPTPILAPHFLEQTEIVRRVETLFACADRLEARYAAARAQVEKLTPATLAKAFRGELVPQDPNDEPAAELLRRVAGEFAAEPLSKRTPKRPKPEQATTGALNSLAKTKDDTMKKHSHTKLEDIAPNHLANILHTIKQQDAKAVWSSSGLSIDDFYVQLSREISAGLLRVSKDDESQLELVSVGISKG